MGHWRVLVVSMASSFMLATGCGDDDGGAGARPDAMVAASPDAMVAPVCTLLEENYGDLGAVTGEALLRPVDDGAPDGLQYLSLQIPLNAESPPDVLFVELWDGTKPFEGGITVGMHTIGGLQADLFSCGACVYIAADMVQGEKLKFHMASAGTVSIDLVDPIAGTGRITGSLEGLRLREVNVDASGQTVVPEGCVTHVDAASFDFTIATP